MEHSKVDTGTQWETGDTANASPSQSIVKVKELSLEVETKLVMLANKMLHASYWFLLLGVTFTGLDLAGLARAARVREAAAREGASSILCLVKEEGGATRLVDIARPDTTDEEMGAEQAVRTMASLDSWLEQGVLEAVLGFGRSGIGEGLRKVLDKCRELRWESQGMREQVGSAE